jgi:GTP-binding protein
LKAAAEKAAASKKPEEKGGGNPNKLLADYELIVRAKLKFLSYAPIVFLSALTGDRVEKLYSMLDRVAAARQRRVSTGELNRWLSNVDLERGTSPANREVKIFYITQATVAPPTFVLFTNQLKPLHFSYQRFLENRLRAAFDFIGTPLRFNQRLKKRAARTHIAARGEDRERRKRQGPRRQRKHEKRRGNRDKSRRK